MDVRKEEEIIQVNLRLPRSLHRRLAQEAKKARRALNSEMVVRLEHSLERDDADEILQHATSRYAGAHQLYTMIADQTGLLPRLPSPGGGLLGSLPSKGAKK
jgi:Arc-like DNA binding domain